ncbi:tyrosine-type recombinase/integrase [Aliiruegeria sabulilitoris]|uniref:tyrosine-type recombinase/integrase n=1 Tax=Aliiruegeria sabulilitoris TaxID=1510458 RepID=UPI00082C84BB|nr:tyrosine-type recombinase/integrase [Aliiruegeria sabulilitoris]NDR57911.1 site-specific integrase [Pseudoruegeria sp. M32A2M]
MVHPDYRPIELKQADWPCEDRKAWEALFAEGDILDGRGPLAHWRETTRRKCAQSYGYWLAYLERMGQLGGTTHPADRLTPETVKAYVETTLDRCTVETTHMRLNELAKVVRAMSPESDWEWLTNVEGRLRKQCRHGELKRRAGVTALDLYAWGFGRMQSAEADETLSPKERAVQYRQGLLIAFMISRPLRRRSLLALRVGKGLVETGGHFFLCLEPAEMKDNKALDQQLPLGLEGVMARYLSHHREILLDGAKTDALWVTKYGGEFSVSGFVGSLAKLTRREFGEVLRPHAFRHIAATSVALEDPENVNIIASVLRHGSLETSETYYNRARGIDAIQSYQNVVRDIRKSAGRKRLQLGGRRPRMSKRDTA